MTIWFWFMEFVLLTFLLLWVCQVLFLQNFYDRMKTKDIIKLTDEMVAEYQNKNYESTYLSLAVQNDLCIEVLDKYEREKYAQHSMGGSCFLHGYDNHVREIVREVIPDADGIIYFKDTHPDTNVDVLVFARVLGSVDDPEGYLILNTPLTPVTATVNIIRRQLVMITIILILAALIITSIVSDRLAKPIVRVTKDAEQLAHGKYDIRFNGNGYDEAEKLAETLTYASHEINRVDIMQRDLIANASHDLRTPLTMLKGYAEMIRDISGDNPEKRNKHLQVIIEETDRLQALVNDILDLSKLENGRMTLAETEFDMELRLKEITERYRGLSDFSGYHFSLETDGEAIVFCDAGKIEQVICNLINNAVNYTGEDKQIFIQMQHVDEGIRISVKDTGKGMDQETLSRIFDKYYRSENYKRSVVGTGLGLSIVKAILRLHDYAFGVDSTIGKGSTFWFIIHKEE
ncbi:MAG: HAMP domain-containing histidine kinase [Oscillospiraceae bacterium]|nr:HAMP domain-containing histidine kinase [Oscillospiraceae bacterium]